MNKILPVWKYILVLFIPALLAGCAAQNPQQLGDLRLLDWEPKSMLVVKETEVLKPKFPVIDFHNHLRRLEYTEQYLEEMDKAGVWMTVSLDGNPENGFYREHLDVSRSVSEDRFLVFYCPDFSRIDEPNWGEDEAMRLEEAVGYGIRGLKINKALGLTHRDATGELVKVDDPRIDPVWAKCGELGIPVVIHVTDPKAFHEGPVDRYNERYHELAERPEWSFYGPQWPSKEEILQARNRVIARHPETIFIATHMANLPEELGRVSMWLEKYPNMYIDINARISELGRQPYTARRFMIQWQDRILFGTDTPPDAEAYRVHYRFLETDDEYFDPTPAHKQQGFWMIYGLYLPDEVLEKVYNKNALRILGKFKGVN